MQAQDRLTKGVRGTGGAFHLPVLRPSGGPARPRRSHIGHWRAAVLIAVHVAMIVHVLHWWYTGRSLGRFVLSDSMKTLELGDVNPGFLLFAAAMLVTAVAGRFMCGWVCHMGALQDLCAWLLRRCGLRPHLFRSRALGYVPLAVAVYMFVWPTLAREVVEPSLRRVWPTAAQALGTHPFPGFRADLMTADLWDGLPTWWLAVPFLLLCGFATVYFLGARGLCRYGCPYGGFLLPAEKLARWSVVADPALCDQCGLCTSACTAGVRVHEQVAQHGAVVDVNCVRSLDCVGACPSRALSFGRSAAGVNIKDRVRYDLSVREEAACAAAFVVVFFITRGLWNAVPMLAAVTLGVLAAFFAWKSLRLVHDPNVRLGFLRLRTGGAMRPAGWGFTACIVILSVFMAHTFILRTVLAWASYEDGKISVAYEEAVQHNVPSDQREAAERGARLYRAARPFWHGGFAVAPTPESEFRLAWMDLVAGDAAGARLTLEHRRRGVHNPDVAAVELAKLWMAAGNRDTAAGIMEDAIEAHPTSLPVLSLHAEMLVGEGRGAEAVRAYRSAVVRRPNSGPLRAGLGRVLVRTGHADEGLLELRSAAAAWPGDVRLRRELALGLFATGRHVEAEAELKAAAESRPIHREELMALAAWMRNARR